MDKRKAVLLEAPPEGLMAFHHHLLSGRGTLAQGRPPGVYLHKSTLFNNSRDSRNEDSKTCPRTRATTVPGLSSPPETLCHQTLRRAAVSTGGVKSAGRGGWGMDCPIRTKVRPTGDHMKPRQFCAILRQGLPSWGFHLEGRPLSAVLLLLPQLPLSPR